MRIAPGDNRLRSEPNVAAGKARAAQKPRPVGGNRRGRKPDAVGDSRRDYVERFLEELKREYPNRDLAFRPIVARIMRAALYFEQALARTAASQGLKVGELLVLGALRRAGAPYCLRPTELLEGLWVTPGAVTKRIDRLIALGLVDREHDQQDRRGVIVRLTPRGRKVVDAGYDTDLQEVEHRAVSKLSATERAELARLLHKLLLALEETSVVGECERP